MHPIHFSLTERLLAFFAGVSIGLMWCYFVVPMLKARGYYVVRDGFFQFFGFLWSRAGGGWSIVIRHRRGFFGISYLYKAHCDRIRFELGFKVKRFAFMRFRYTPGSKSN